MAKKLKTYVHAVETDDKGQIVNQGVFGPDDDLSKPENAWVEKSISNPDVWEGSEDTEQAQPAGQVQPAVQAEPGAKPAGRSTAAKPATK